MSYLNRKAEEGDLLKETLGIILFVIGAGILIFAVWKVWDIAVNQERESAEELVDNIVKRTERINDREVGGFNIEGLEKWFLVGWSKNEAGRTDKCFFNSCICICKGNKRDARKVCQDGGICKELEFEEVKLYDFNKAKDGVMKFKEEEVIKDLNNFDSYGIGQWSDKSYNFNLLSECAYFSGNNIFKFLVYKEDRKLAIFRIKDIDFSNLGFEAACEK